MLDGDLSRGDVDVGQTIVPKLSWRKVQKKSRVSDKTERREMSAVRGTTSDDNSNLVVEGMKQSVKTESCSDVVDIFFTQRESHGHASMRCSRIEREASGTERSRVSRRVRCTAL